MRRPSRVIFSLWAAVSGWRKAAMWVDQLPAIHRPQWRVLQSKNRQLFYQLTVTLSILFGLKCLFDRENVSPLAQQRPSPIGELTPSVGHIPPKIWQVYLDYSPDQMAPYRDQVMSWISHNPSYDYTILDKDGAVSMMSNLSEDPLYSQILPVFYAMGRRVMRADFLRYLILATQGGIYSDVDTQLLKPVESWIPEEFKASTRLIVGLEADQSPPVAGTTYEVQFCQWTLAAAPSHPAMLEMVRNILEQVQNRPYQDPPADVDYRDAEVLDITGPAGWTRVIYKYLSQAVGAPIDWRNLTGLKEPRLYGDILILPIDAFATGVPHSGAVKGGSPDALILHSFSGSWKHGYG